MLLQLFKRLLLLSIDMIKKVDILGTLSESCGQGDFPSLFLFFIFNFRSLEKGREILGNL